MTIRMRRDDKYADVHPDEVKNWSSYGWSTVEQPSKNGATEAMVQPAPSVPLPDLASLVDDRALPGLESIGVSTTQELIAKYHADPKAVLAVAYMTNRTIAKVIK